MDQEIERLMVWRKLPSEPTEEKKYHKIGCSLVAAVRELEEFGWVSLLVCAFLTLRGILQRGVLNRSPAAALVSGHQHQTVQADLLLPASKSPASEPKEEGLALPISLNVLIQNNVVPLCSLPRSSHPQMPPPLPLQDPPAVPLHFCLSILAASLTLPLKPQSNPNSLCPLALKFGIFVI